MSKNLFLIVIIAACPVFASCPVGIDAGACVAEFQTMNIQDIIPPENKLTGPVKQKEFSGVKNDVPIEEEIGPTKSLRTFGPNNSDYGYNSSCQFGICPNTGTPQNFPANNNQ